MTIADDLGTTFYRLLFPVAQPAASIRPREQLGVAAKDDWTPSLCCYIGMVVVAFSPVLGTIYKIYRARQSSRKRMSQSHKSVVSTSPAQLFSMGQGSLSKCMHYEFKTHGLDKVEPSRHAHDNVLGSGDGYKGVVTAQAAVTEIKYKQSSPNAGPKVIKLLIKRPTLQAKDFQDCKRRFLYSLKSPAKKAKRDKRPHKDGGAGEPEAVDNAVEHVVQDALTPDYVYNTARPMMEPVVECLSPMADICESVEDFYNQNPPSQSSLRPNKHNSSKSISPTRRKRKKRQQQRSIFSKSWRSKRTKELEYTVSEAYGPCAILKNAEDKTKTDMRKKDQTLTQVKSSCLETLAKGKTLRDKNCALQKRQVPAEPAALELKSLMRQVEYENRNRKSVSPRRSMSFIKTRSNAGRMLFPKHERMKSVVSVEKKMSKQQNQQESASAKGFEHLKSCISSRLRHTKSHKSHTWAAGEAIAQQAPSEPLSKLGENSRITRGVSLSILNKIAFMHSAADKDSSKPKRRSEHMRTNRKPDDNTKTKETEFCREPHTVFIKAPVCFSAKSPSVELCTKKNFKTTIQDDKRTRDSAMQTEQMVKLVSPEHRLSGKTCSQCPNTSAELEHKRDHFFQNKKYANKKIYSKREESPQRIYHNHLTQTQPHEPENTHKPLPGKRHLQPSFAKPQDPASISQSSHYSCLGCIDPTESSKARVEQTPSKNVDIHKPKGEKNPSRAQPIEGYILNSKTPIANTLLLCRSGITTTYENWASVEAQGPGAVKACSKAPCSNKFPSLSSYLDFLEGKTTTAQPMQKHKKEDGVQEQTESKHVLNHETKMSKNDVMFHEEIFGAAPKSSLPASNKKSFPASKTGETVTPVKQASEKLPKRNEQEAIQYRESSPETKKTVTNGKGKLFDRIKKTLLASPLMGKFKPQDKKLNVPNPNKSLSTLKKDDSKRPVRAKLKYKYLPLRKQPLSQANSQKRENKKGNNELLSNSKQSLKSTKSVKSRTKSVNQSQEKETKRETNSTLSKDIKGINHRTTEQVAKGSSDVVNNHAEANKVPGETFTKPVVVNLRKLARLAMTSPKLQQPGQTTSSNSPEKQEKDSPRATNNVSAEETSLSLDLQSLLEMAKTVLKKSKRKSLSTKTEQTANSTCATIKLDIVKCDDQTSGSSQGKCSNLNIKNDGVLKRQTSEDRSYTHLYKIGESQSSKPWRTTKAFTNRLKLMLQRNKEDCQRRRASERTTKPRDHSKKQKAYVVHNAALANLPIKKKTELDSSEIKAVAQKPSPPLNNPVQKGSCEPVKTNSQVVAREATTSSEKVLKPSSGPPTLRTEALARKRRKNAETPENVSVSLNQTANKKKRLRSKGTPLELTSKQLCSNGKYVCIDDFIVHPATTQIGLRTQHADLQDKHRDLIAESVRQRLPLIGLDPAQVASRSRGTFSADTLGNNQQCTTPRVLDRSHQVQSELCVLLNKLKTHATEQVPYLANQRTEHNNNTDETEERFENKLCVREYPDDEPAIEHATTSRSKLEVSASPDPAASSPSWKSSGHAEVLRAKKNADLSCDTPSKTLLIHSELDPVPSSAALRLLKQCHCSQFHSMPLLSAPCSHSPTITEVLQENKVELPLEEFCSKQHSHVPVTVTSPVVESDNCGSKHIIVSKNMKSKETGISDHHSPIETPTLLRQNVDFEKQEMSSQTFSPQNSQNFVKRIRKYGNRPPITQQCNSDERLCLSKIKPVVQKVPSTLSPNTAQSTRELAANAAFQYKQARMTITSPRCPSKKGEAKQSPKTKNKRTNPSTEQTPENELKDSQHKVANSASKNEITNIINAADISLTSAKMSPKETRRSLTNEVEDITGKTPPRLDNDKPTMSIFGMAIEDIRDFQEGDLRSGSHELDKYGRGGGYEPHPAYNYVSMNPSAAVTSGAFNFTKTSENELVLLSESLHDLEQHSGSKKSAEISSTTVLERRHSCTSGYGTAADVSSSSTFSHRTKIRARNAHSLSSIITERFRKEGEALVRQTPADFDLRCAIPVDSKTSCNMLDRQSARQVSARKVLSHITEESDRSEARFIEGTRSDYTPGRRFAKSKQNVERAKALSQQEVPEEDVGGLQVKSNIIKYEAGEVCLTGELKYSESSTNHVCRITNRSDELTVRVSEQKEKQCNVKDDCGALRPSSDICPRADISPESWQRDFLMVQRNPSKGDQYWNKKGSYVLSKTNSDAFVTKSEPDLNSGKDKNRIDEIPVTIVYTNENSEVPELSFINEDEISLDSWTRNSANACYGKCEHSEPCINSAQHKKDTGKAQNCSSKVVCLVPPVQDAVTEVHNSPNASKKAETYPDRAGYCPGEKQNLKREEDENESQDRKSSKCVKDTFDAKHANSAINKKDYDFSEQNTDLESLLDSALDKSSVGMKPCSECLALPKSSPRMPRDHQFGKRAVRSFLGQNKRFHLSRESHGPGMAHDELIVNRCTKRGPKAHSRAQRTDDSLDQFLMRRGSTKRKLWGIKIRSDSASLPEYPRPGNDSKDEKALQDILKDVPTHPLGLVRNKRPKRDEAMCIRCGEDAQQTRVAFTSEKTPNKLNVTENVINSEGEVDKLHETCIPAIESQHNIDTGSDLPKRTQFDAECTQCNVHKSLRKIPKEHDSNCHDDRQVDTKLLDAGMSKCPQISRQAPVWKRLHQDIKKCIDRREGSSRHDLNMQVTGVHEEKYQTNLDTYDGDRCLIENSDSAFDARKETMKEDCVHTLSEEPLEQSVEKYGQKPEDVSAEICLKNLDHTDNPCSSSSSSIVLSWVGSHEGFDMERDNVSLTNSGEFNTRKAESLKSACSKEVLDRTATYSNSLYGEETIHSLEKFGLETRNCKTNEGRSALPLQESAIHKFKQEKPQFSNHSSNSVTGTGRRFEQNNSNKNKPKSKLEAYAFSSETMFNLPTQICNGERHFHHTDEMATVSLGSRFDGCDKEDVEDYDYLKEIGISKAKEDILEQESYLHNLVRNLQWEEEVPSVHWSDVLTSGSTGEHLQTVRDTQGERNARCGYVISAWTNQRLHGDLMQSTTRTIGSCRTASSLKMPGQDKSPVTSFWNTENKLKQDCKAYVSPDSKHITSNSEGIQIRPYHNRGHICYRQESRSPKTYSPNSECAFDCNRPWSGLKNPREKRLGETLKESNIKAKVPTSPQGEYDQSCVTRRQRVALTLEEHLRSRCGTPGWYRENASKAASLKTSGSKARPFKSLNDHLSGKCEAAWPTPADHETEAEVCQGPGGSRRSKSPSSHSSLNWYRPQSLSSSNSVSNSQTPSTSAAAAVRTVAEDLAALLPRERYLPCSATFLLQGQRQRCSLESSRQNTALGVHEQREVNGVRQQREVNGVRQQQLPRPSHVSTAALPTAPSTVTPATATSRRDERGTTSRINGPSGGPSHTGCKKVSTIVEMFEMKNSSARQG